MPTNDQPVVTRLRVGLATNSSSSHAMVVLPPDQHVADIIPADLDFSTGWRAASEGAKRLVLAGMLRREAPLLWRAATADSYAQPAVEARWRGEEAQVYTFSVTIPDQLERRIALMCDLPEESFFQGPRPFTACSFGGDVELPRRPGGEGPIPAAWMALKELILRPEVTLFAPEENSWDSELSGLKDQWYDIQAAVDAAPVRPDL